MLLLLYWNFSPECCMMFVIHYSRAVLIATQAFNCKSTVKVAFLWALCALTEQIKDTLLLRLQCFFFLPTPNAEHPKMGNDIIVFANYALQGTTNSAIPSRRCPPPAHPPVGTPPSQQIHTSNTQQYCSVFKASLEVIDMVMLEKILSKAFTGLSDFFLFLQQSCNFWAPDFWIDFNTKTTFFVLF